MCKVDYGLAQRCIGLVGTGISDQSTIEFEFGEWQLFQPRQRCVAAAEIVNGEPYLERL